MPTHAELTARLLQDTATFFDNLGSENTVMQAQMKTNAQVFRQMADVLTAEPDGTVEGTSFGVLAGKLLQDAAVFFRALAEENEHVREQMQQNAEIFEQLGKLVADNPLGILD